MFLRSSVAVVRWVSLATLALVVAVTLVLLVAGHAGLAAATATLGVALLSGLLGLITTGLARTEGYVDQLQAELAVAYRDPVTGLALRTVAERHLLEVAGTDVTVALVDVDDMHGINSVYHHDGGDVFLAAVAQRMTQAAEPGDLVARLGGDEFAVITRQDPQTLAARLSAALAAPVTIGRSLQPMTVSVGICRVPGGDPHTALGRADRAMFTAKRRGSGIEYYDAARDGVPLPRGVRPLVRRRDQRMGRTAGSA
jgi:diguanylate cyclase (GGDEF)-like protein